MYTPEITALLASLVAIDSVNPSLVPGGSGEVEIAAFIEAWARDAGLATERLEQTAGRPTVLVRSAPPCGSVPSAPSYGSSTSVPSPRQAR